MILTTETYTDSQGGSGTMYFIAKRKGGWLHYGSEVYAGGKAGLWVFRLADGAHLAWPIPHLSSAQSSPTGH